MATLTIRNVPDEVHRAIRVRASQNGRSTEAEVREILAQTARTGDRLKIGSELRRYADQFGGVELEVRRDPAPIVPASFEPASSG